MGGPRATSESLSGTGLQARDRDPGSALTGRLAPKLDHDDGLEDGGFDPFLLVTAPFVFSLFRSTPTAMSRCCLRSTLAWIRVYAGYWLLGPAY
jgi:hypothetical protein